jgi:hypothetical protein
MVSGLRAVRTKGKGAWAVRFERKKGRQAGLCQLLKAMRRRRGPGIDWPR